MRRISVLLAAAAIGMGGLASSATAAPEYTVCYGEYCVCITGPGIVCHVPDPGSKCIAIDIDGDGRAEKICPAIHIGG